jgi:hypothetical protein
MSTQSQFDSALARADERAQRTDFDQHIVADESGEFVVIDEGNGMMPQWLIDQIIYTVTGKLCISDELDDISPAYTGWEETGEAAAEQRQIDREGDWLDDELQMTIWDAMERSYAEDSLPY